MRRVGSSPLKILLLAVCIAAALFVIYLRLRPPQPARVAPGFTPGIGRRAAHYANRQADESPDQTDQRNDQ